MTITKHVVKSCCGNQSFIMEADKPIRKSQIQLFKDAGFMVPDNFFNAGVFYVQSAITTPGGTLIATASYGTGRINVRCTGTNCSALLVKFESLLNEAVHS